MFNPEITSFAETTFRNKYIKFGIKRDDRRRHMYLIGKTGMGKSTILENMIVEDIRNGHGVAIVDPHGDLAEKVIEYVPTNRVNDIIYFNPADMDFPIAFNIVEHVDPHYRHLVASGLIGVFQKLWADSWGPRLEYILRNAILAVLDYPGSTLLAVTRMLSDKAFRKKVIEKIENPVVKAFWVNEFAGYNDKFASEAVSPIQNKVGQFLSSSLIRNIIGQVKSTIDMRKIMDEGKVLIVNLSKGRIGEDNSSLLGAMMITKIQLAAMSRVDIPEDERRDFYLYVDEFQNFTSDSFANILSEARKYRLNLTLAHQYIEQLSESVKFAVFGNVGTLIAFRVGAADAEALEPEFTPTFTLEDILNLPKYEMYMKLMIDGIASQPFSARGLPPLSKDEKTGNVEKVIAVSRERYAKNRAVVEDRIARWHSGDDPVDVRKAASTLSGAANSQKAVNPTYVKKDFATTPSSVPGSGTTYKKPEPVVNMSRANTNIGTTTAPNTANVLSQALSPVKAPEMKPSPAPSLVSSVKRVDPVYKFSAQCVRCHQTTNLPFAPDGIRPIYCKTCLNVIKEEKNIAIEKRRLDKKEELKTLDRSRFASNTKPFIQTAKTDHTVLNKNSEIDSVPAPKELSLSDALKMNPVAFSKNAHQKPAPDVLKSNTDSISFSAKKEVLASNSPAESLKKENEMDLTEDQVITF